MNPRSPSALAPANTQPRGLPALLFTALAAGLIAFPAPAADSRSTPNTEQLIVVLRSDASFFEKARACQQLGEVGTREAIPALAALLDSPELAAYARSGLEGIPDPAAAAALREAAGRLKGAPLAGVVNSLGVLRDSAAEELLGKLAADPNSGVAREALLALGNIASSRGILILKLALTSGPNSTRADAAAACLLAADRHRAGGDLPPARELYDLVRAAPAPMACRVGATRGAILVRQADRVPFLVEQLHAAEPPIRNAALLTIREIPGEALAAALNTELTRAQPDLQRQLLLALADCHNAQSVPAIATLAQGAEAALRSTALLALGRIGPEAAPALLAALQNQPNAPDKSLIFTGLKAMEGPAVDALVRQALTASTNPEVSIDLVHLLARRGVTEASGQILKLAVGTNQPVRLAALSALQSLAGTNEVRGLIGLLKTGRDQAVRDAAEEALAAACGRSGSPSDGAKAILAELKTATQPADRNGWVRVLATVGYAPALPAIEAAAGDPNEAVADNALAQLGRWPDPAPMPTLLQALDHAASPRLCQRALVSVIDLAATAADERQAPEPAIVGWLGRVAPLAPSLGEKRRILGILGRLKTAESFRLLVPYLDDSNLRTEAASAVVQIAPALSAGPEAAALKRALETIAATVTNPDLRDRALRAAKSIPAKDH